jgi:hypothetical protein
MVRIQIHIKVITLIITIPHIWEISLNIPKKFPTITLISVINQLTAKCQYANILWEVKAVAREKAVLSFITIIRHFTIFREKL